MCVVYADIFIPLKKTVIVYIFKLYFYYYKIPNQRKE